MRNTVLAIAALSLAAACSKGEEYKADSAGGVVGASTTTAPAPAPTLSDQNIVAKIGAADSAEIGLAKLAQTKATNAGVKSFARLLVTDHSSHAKELATIERQANLTPQPPANDDSAQEAQQALDRFTSLEKGAAFDTAFVNHEVDDHQKVISELQSLETQAQSPELKQLITKTLPVLQKHLERAQTLQKQLSGTR